MNVPGVLPRSNQSMLIFVRRAAERIEVLVVKVEELSDRLRVHTQQFLVIDGCRYQVCLLCSEWCLSERNGSGIF